MCGRNAILRKKFGCLNAETWQSDLKRGFKECWRVLEDYGVLILKWNDINISAKRVLNVFSESPLFVNISSGGRKNSSKTYWFCFMKIPKSLEEVIKYNIRNAEKLKKEF